MYKERMALREKLLFKTLPVKTAVHFYRYQKAMEQIQEFPDETYKMVLRFD